MAGQITTNPKPVNDVSPVKHSNRCARSQFLLPYFVWFFGCFFFFFGKAVAYVAEFIKCAAEFTRARALFLRLRLKLEHFSWQNWNMNERGVVAGLK